MALVADEDGEVVVTPLFQDVVEVVVVATHVVDDLYDVVRYDVLKDLVRADVDHVVVDGVDELLSLLVVDAVALVAEFFVVALSDADLDVSHVDFVVNSLSLSLSLSLTLVDEPLVVVLFDADLDVSHLVDVVVTYLYVVVVNLLVVELYLYVVLVVEVLVVVVDTLDVVDELSLSVVD